MQWENCDLTENVIRREKASLQRRDTQRVRKGLRTFDRVTWVTKLCQSLPPPPPPTPPWSSRVLASCCVLVLMHSHYVGKLPALSRFRRKLQSPTWTTFVQSRWRQQLWICAREWFQISWLFLSRILSIRCSLLTGKTETLKMPSYSF